MSYSRPTHYHTSMPHCRTWSAFSFASGQSSGVPMALNGSILLVNPRALHIVRDITGDPLLVTVVILESRQGQCSSSPHANNNKCTYMYIYNFF